MPIYIAALFSLGIITFSQAFERFWGKYVGRWKATLFLFSLGGILLIEPFKLQSFSSMIYCIHILFISLYICQKVRPIKDILTAILIVFLISMVMEIVKILASYQYYWIADKYIYYTIGILTGILSVIFNERYETAFLSAYLGPVFIECIDYIIIAFEDGLNYIIAGTNNEKFCLVCSILIALYLIPVKFRIRTANMRLNRA